MNLIMKYFSQREVRPRHNDSLAAERCWVPAVGTNRGESTALTLKYFLHLEYFQERVESLLEAFRPGRERERDKVRLNIFKYFSCFDCEIFPGSAVVAHQTD